MYTRGYPGGRGGLESGSFLTMGSSSGTSVKPMLKPENLCAH